MTDSKHQITKFMAIFASGTMLSRVMGLVRDIVLAKYVPTGSLGLFWGAFRLPNTLRDLLGEGATNAAFVPTFAEAKDVQTPEEYRHTVSAVYSAMWIVFTIVTIAGVVIASFAPNLLGALELFTKTSEPKIFWTDNALGMGECVGANTVLADGPVGSGTVLATANTLPRLADNAAATTDPHTIVRMIQWCFPYIFFIGLGVFCMAPLFVARHYSTPSWTPVLLSVTLIGSCLVLRNYFAEPAWGLVIGVWLGGISQMLVLTWAMHKHVGVLWPNFDLRHPAIKKCAALLTPVIIGQSAGPINKWVNTFFAVSLGPSTVTALTYANNLVQLPLSIFGVAVSVAILPSISRSGARGELHLVRDTLIHGLRQSFFLVMPAMVLLMVLSSPAVRLLFERGYFGAETTAQTAAATLYYGSGLLAFAWVKVCVQGFYALKDTKTPVAAAGLSMLLNIALNFALVGPMGFRGLAFATTIAYTVNFAMLYVLLCRRYGPLWNRSMFIALAQMSLACLLTGATAYGALWAIEHYVTAPRWILKFITVALPGALGIAVYGGTSHFLHLEEFRTLTAALRRRNAPPEAAIDTDGNTP